MGEVEEERLVAGVAEEPHGLGDVALGERRLVGLLLDHLVVEQQRQRRVAELVAVGSSVRVPACRPMSLLYGRPK